MGATSFIQTVDAISAREAQEILIKKAKEEYGSHPYNGTISTCYSFRCAKTFDKYSKANEQKMLEYASRDFTMETRTARYIDLGVAYYMQTTVKKIPQTCTAKYEQRYAVVDMTGKLISPTSYRTTKTEAINLAMEYAIKGVEVAVNKMPILVSGNSTCTTFCVEQTRVSKMSKDTKNKKTIPIHKYIFYGLAAE